MVKNLGILRIKKAKFVFVWTQTYREILKSALVYLSQVTDFFSVYNWLYFYISKFVFSFSIIDIEFPTLPQFWALPSP